MHEVTGYAARIPGSELAPWRFSRRDPRPDDVVVRVTYCGVCHSDLHAVDGAAAEEFPLVPGHEFVGVVAEVGTAGD
ncbi:MAG: alcohol dehydrogenase [Pseudonocardiales bacterium]|nr:alcohol dehydrogenase [Pseudonocardiales bacterium]